MAYCPDCSRPGRLLEHGDPRSCPFLVRYNAVGCVRIGCGRPTRRHDALCSDGCAQVVASYKAAR